MQLNSNTLSYYPWVSVVPVTIPTTLCLILYPFTADEQDSDADNPPDRRDQARRDRLRDGDRQPRDRGGVHEQRQVRDHDGAEDRRPGLRSARGHRRGEAQDGDDGLRQPHARGHQVVSCYIHILIIDINYLLLST